MAKFLKDTKMLSELTKGVQAMKQYIYPSVLQKEAIPVLKKQKKNANVIVRYSMMSGIKLTIFLPTLNQLIRQVVTTAQTPASPMNYVLVLCHSTMRCGEIEGFLTDLVTFCKDVVDVLGLYSNDAQDNIIRLRESLKSGSDMKQTIKSKCKVIVTTPTQLVEILKKDGLKNSQCSSLIVDKIDMHIALDLSGEIQQIAEKGLKPIFKTIITTNFKDGSSDQETELKKALMGDQKALIIQVNEDHRMKSKFERLDHLYILCQTLLDKFVIAFTLIKLGIMDGKILIYTQDVIQAYRLKMFFSRFNLRSFVLNPEMPKNQFKSLIHFFHIGQFNIMIVLQTGYSFQPQFKNISHVLNFDAPLKYNQYKENGSHIEFDNGSELTLVHPQQDKETLELYQRKLNKAFSKSNMIKCIPIMWQELLKIKTRVEDVTRGLDNKTVKNEKVNEFKKQLLSNQRLKEYFKQHPEEKEILQNDILKNDTNKNKIMFKHLDHLPFYVIPQQVMAITPEQLRVCTVGTQNLLTGSLSGSISRDKTLAGSIVMSKGTSDYQDLFVDAESSQSTLVQNLVSLPSVVESYQNREKEEVAETTFAYENPTMVNFEALEPTSGRKQWKIKHHKRVKKKEKVFKNGFKGI